MSRIMVNGVTTSHIHVMDRGLAYGDGVFETIACIDGHVQFWEQHITRMQSAADRLNITFPDSGLFYSDVARLYQDYPDKNSIVKLIVTRGIGHRGYGYDKNQQPTRIAILYEHTVRQSLPETISICLCEHRLPHNHQLAGMKHLNRLDNVLARGEWQQEYYEGLMMDIEDNVIEGTMSNVFAVRNNTLHTPNLERCGVQGIIHDQVIAIAHEHGIKLHIADISIEDLQNMDELFLSNSIMGVVSVDTFVTSSKKYHYKKNELAQFIAKELESRAKTYAKALS